MITIQDVSLFYKHNKSIQENINLKILPGRIYGLLGKNGEGKTTLLNILSGQLFPNKGICNVSGEVPSCRNISFLQKLFLMPEEQKMPGIKINEYIRMYAPFYPAFSNETLTTCFESFEIDRSARLDRISQGERKKVIISLAFSTHTPLLLMDEPTNGLDIPSKEIFRKLLVSFAGEEQTVIISTHQIRDLESLIDAVIILNDKKIILNNALDEISEKLFFRQTEPDEKVFYRTSTPLGTIGVGKNCRNEETPVSLELLFNAAISQPEAISSLFTSKRYRYE